MRQASNVIKKRLEHRCFPVNIVKLIRTPILKNFYERIWIEQKKLQVTIPTNEHRINWIDKV